MRKSLLLSAATFALAFGAPAFVQTAAAQTSGTGYNAGYNAPSTRAPYSAQASNINSQDMRSRIAPILPTPPGAENNSSPEQLLGIAQNALRRGQTGAAQQALEMAETRALDRGTSPSMANTPSSNPMVDQINRALQALGNRDTAGAEQAIQEAMAGSGGMGRPGMANPGMTNNGMGYGTNASTGPGMAPSTGAMVGTGSSGMGMPNTGSPMSPQNPQAPTQTPANATGGAATTGTGAAGMPK